MGACFIVGAYLATPCMPPPFDTCHYTKTRLPPMSCVRHAYASITSRARSKGTGACPNAETQTCKLCTSPACDAEKQALIVGVLVVVILVILRSWGFLFRLKDGLKKHGSGWWSSSPHAGPDGADQTIMIAGPALQMNLVKIKGKEIEDAYDRTNKTDDNTPPIKQNKRRAYDYGRRHTIETVLGPMVVRTLGDRSDVVLAVTNKDPTSRTHLGGDKAKHVVVHVEGPTDQPVVTRTVLALHVNEQIVTPENLQTRLFENQNLNLLPFNVTDDPVNAFAVVVKLARFVMGQRSPWDPWSEPTDSTFHGTKQGDIANHMVRILQYMEGIGKGQNHNYKLPKNFQAEDVGVGMLWSEPTELILAGLTTNEPNVNDESLPPFTQHHVLTFAKGGEEYLGDQLHDAVVLRDDAVKAMTKMVGPGNARNRKLRYIKNISQNSLASVYKDMRDKLAANLVDTFQ